VALLARQDRVKVVGYQTVQGCTTLLDGLGPDGNRDVSAPQNAITCDTNNDGTLDGNRLFSRPPLVVHTELCRGSCAEGDGQVELWLIVNHFKSKVEDSDLVQYTLPRRSEEARFLAGLVQQMIAKPGSNLVILGDLNDFPASQPISILNAQGLTDLWRWAERIDRYSFNYQGISQVLDYILVSLTPAVGPLEFAPVHINADYPAAWLGEQNSVLRSSDHEPLYARFMLADQFVFLPMISTK
jgi:predicted extracellular nuclease